MRASPELSRRLANALAAASRDPTLMLSPDERGRLARAAERAGTFDRLGQRWQRWVDAAERLGVPN